MATIIYETTPVWEVRRLQVAHGDEHFVMPHTSCHGIFQIKEDVDSPEPGSARHISSEFVNDAGDWTYREYFQEYGPLEPYDAMRKRSHP